MTTSAPNTPPRRRWQRWLLGCLAGMVLFCCGGPLVVMGGGWWVASKSVRDDLDQVYRDGLARGDPDAVYAQADPGFRTLYSEDMFRAFARAHRALFERDSLRTSSARFSHGGRPYRAIRVTILADAGTVEVTLIFTEEDDGRLALLGIVPLLADAVPREISRAAAGATVPKTGGGRRSRLRRLFD